MAICLLTIVGAVIYLIGTAISTSTRPRRRDRGEDLRQSGLVGILVACLYWLSH